MGDPRFERSKLIKCTDCGRDISPSAAACPNCGKPLRDPSVQVAKGIVRGVLWVVAAVLLFFFLLGFLGL